MKTMGAPWPSGPGTVTTLKLEASSESKVYVKHHFFKCFFVI